MHRRRNERRRVKEVGYIDTPTVTTTTPSNYCPVIVRDTAIACGLIREAPFQEIADENVRYHAKS